LIYEKNKIIDLIVEDFSDEEILKMDGLDYFEFNIDCAYVGEKTPILCYDNYQI
jgi:hypothetical protein